MSTLQVRDMRFPSRSLMSIILCRARLGEWRYDRRLQGCKSSGDGRIGGTSGDMWLGRRGVLGSIFVVKGNFDKRDEEADGEVVKCPLFPASLISPLASS